MYEVHLTCNLLLTHSDLLLAYSDFYLICTSNLFLGVRPPPRRGPRSVRSRGRSYIRVTQVVAHAPADVTHAGKLTLFMKLTSELLKWSLTHLQTLRTQANICFSRHQRSPMAFPPPTKPLERTTTATATTTQQHRFSQGVTVPPSVDPAAAQQLIATRAAEVTH